MDIEFQLTPVDLLAFAHYHQQKIIGEKGRGLSKWFWGSIVVSAVSLLLANRFGISDSEIHAFFLGWAVAMVGCVLLFIWKYRVAIQRRKRLGMDKRNRYQYEVKRLTLSPEGITETGSQSVGTNRWPRIWHIGVSRDHVFFFDSLDSAFVVPRRAFRDEQHLEEFLALARQYQQGKGQQAPKPTGIIAGLPPQSDAFSRPDAP